MIITRSPLRISFAGGGTDIPAFYKSYGPGAVISTSINRYVYITISEKFDKKVSVRYRNHEVADRVHDLKHDLIRETLLAYGIEDNIEIVISSEVPARGSGLGASSALAVALCLALEKMTCHGPNFDRSSIFEAMPGTRKSILAERASFIEIERVGSPIGKQDQYASSVGGFNCLLFHRSGSVDIEPFKDEEFLSELESQSMLFYLNIGHTYVTGNGREVPDKFFVPRILSDQISEMEEKKQIHILQRDNAIRLKENLQYAVIERFMDHVNENWRLKKNIHRDISNPEIDDFMTRAMRAGASAAKVCGAGGGGFVYLLAQPDLQDSIRKELAEFIELKFSFDKSGAEIIFSENSRQGAFA